MPLYHHLNQPGKRVSGAYILIRWYSTKPSMKAGVLFNKSSQQQHQLIDIGNCLVTLPAMSGRNNI